MIKITEVVKPVLNITNEKRPRTSPLFNAHTKQRVFSLENVEIVFWVWRKWTTGRLTKERITKDVRYQESREVTLEWWDYNHHSRVTSFFRFAQNKSHYEKQIKFIGILNICFKGWNPLLGGFLHFMWLFSRARPLCRTFVRRRLVDHVFCIESLSPPLPRFAQNKSHYEKQIKFIGILYIHPCPTWQCH